MAVKSKVAVVASEHVSLSKSLNDDVGERVREVVKDWFTILDKDEERVALVREVKLSVVALDTVTVEVSSGDFVDKMLTTVLCVRGTEKLWVCVWEQDRPPVAVADEVKWLVEGRTVGDSVGDELRDGEERKSEFVAEALNRFETLLVLEDVDGAVGVFVTFVEEDFVNDGNPKVIVVERGNVVEQDSLYRFDTVAESVSSNMSLHVLDFSVERVSVIVQDELCAIEHVREILRVSEVLVESVAWLLNVPDLVFERVAVSVELLL